MNQNSIKLELIEWLKEVNNPEILSFLKLFKENRSDSHSNQELSQAEIDGINRGLNQLENGQYYSNNEVMAKHGL